MPDGSGGNREFLANLSTGVIEAFPAGSNLSSLSPDSTEALLNIRAISHHRAYNKQYVVQVPHSR